MSSRPLLPAASNFFRVFFELRASCSPARQCQHTARRAYSTASSSRGDHLSRRLHSPRTAQSRHSSSTTSSASKSIADSRHPSDDYPDVYDPRKPVEPPSQSPEDESPTSEHLPGTSRTGQHAAPSQRTQEQHTASATSHPQTSSSDTLSVPLRALMRLVPHPVTLITASLPSSSTTTPESTFRGATVSSFNTVSLSPVPLVSLNMKLPSSTYSALQASGGTFLAHILAANYTGKRIADAFARGNGTDGSVFAGLVGAGADGVGGRSDGGQAARKRMNTSTDIKVFTGPATSGAPLIASSGVLKVLRCRALPGKEVVVGDHVVLVAAVEGLLSLPETQTQGRRRRGSGPVGNALNYVRGDDEAARDERDVHGLVYVDGAYRSVDRETDLVDMEAVDPDGEGVAGQDGEEAPIQRTMGLNVRRGDEYA